jgi:hypothetical protein
MYREVLPVNSLMSSFTQNENFEHVWEQIQGLGFEEEEEEEEANSDWSSQGNPNMLSLLFSHDQANNLKEVVIIISLLLLPECLLLRTWDQGHFFENVEQNKSTKQQRNP